MATTMFPKSYLLERIDARIASLERQDIDDTATVANWRAARLKERKKWIRDTVARAGGLPHRLAEVTDETGNDWETVERVAQTVARLVSEWPKDPINEFYSWGSPRRREDEDASGAKGRLAERARERNALQHTRAYLTDTPVEEFSMTTLAKLGLVDAVKFSLDDARKEAEAKKKR